MIRLVAPLTLVLGVVTLATGLAMSMIAVPFAMATMITGVCWYVEQPRAARRNGLCTGCHGGCVECRERIELGSAR